MSPKNLNTDLPELFPSFSTQRIACNDTELHVRIGGAGPPLLLLHGYPQTHACWHKVAPLLMKTFTLVMPDLRGYGQSAAPPGDDKHECYSKRNMAKDCVEMMRELGYQMFLLAGHDRGGRVAYRLALDFPELVEKLAVLDIVPTSEAWDAMDSKGANGKFHWTYLVQPYPLPERMISAETLLWHEHLLASWSANDDLSCFDEKALQHYRASFCNEATIHAMCEDYRAGYSTDYQLDLADLKAGRRIQCEVLALWGQKRSLGTVSNTLDTWQKWSHKVVGKPIVSGHFLPEENADDTAQAMLEFLRE